MTARGFTLIELLISITIIGVVLVIVAGAFRIAVNAWEKGEGDIAAFQRQQIVLELVKHQLASIQHTEIEKPEEKPYTFRADEQTLEFVSSLSIVPGSRYGEVFVKYRIRENPGEGGLLLEVYETGLSAAGPEGESPFEPEDEAYHVLLDRMQAIRFEFLVEEDPEDPESGPAVWEAAWDPEAFEAELPLAVRFIIQADEGKPPVSAAGRIAVEPADRQGA
jgi:general secretion pathway protein J